MQYAIIPDSVNRAVNISMTLETTEEMADFYARMNVVENPDLGEHFLEEAQDLPFLPEPNEEIFADFSEKLEVILADMDRLSLFD